MIYIPEDWIVNKEHSDEIRAIISNCLGCFRFDNEEDSFEKARKKLKELNEIKILKELEKGTFAQVL